MPSVPSVTSHLQTDADPLVGRLINDRYKVVEPIGHGGMGRVYKAMQSPLDRVVALKVLGAGHDRDPNFYKRFFLEASVTAKLTHPNTITLYDYGKTSDGVVYIAMEFLAGRTLSQAMQADGPLAQERVIHIAQQICRSLREAHGLGIIHRDLKPANVMLLRQHDDHDFVKVLDFGLVKFFSGENGADNDITNAGTFMGSPHYIAPEQARNSNPDQRCDIYSLGVLLYHMLTARVPFTAPAPVDIILKHLHEAPVAPRALRPDLAISPELEAIVLRCMQKKREDRFQSMDELLSALKVVRAHLSGVPVASSMPPYDPNAPTPSMAMRTPSQPMPVAGTPAGGLPAMPPPPPEEALELDLPKRPAPRARPAAAPRATPTPSFNRIADDKPSLFRPAVILPVAFVLVAGAGAFLYLRAMDRERADREAAIAAATVAPITTDVSEKPAAPAVQAATTAAAATPPAAPATTLVAFTSTPAGAEVRDGENHVLGTTPFELSVPSAKELQLTVRHDGYRTLAVHKVASGERMPLSVILEKEPAAKPEKRDGNGRRSVGYKDDPY